MSEIKQDSDATQAGREAAEKALEQSGLREAVEQAQDGAAVYVVQAARSISAIELSEDVPEAVTEVWVDLATISLPPKSQRKGAIRKALAEAGIKPTADLDAVRVRVLDADSARVVDVPVVVAEPTFDI